MPVQLASRTEQLLLFGRNFIKHPRDLGSLIPSSRFLVNHLLAQVDWPQARVFLEYGPGVGTFTTEILRRMRPDAVLVAMETNGDFVDTYEVECEILDCMSYRDRRPKPMRLSPIWSSAVRTT